MSAPLTTLRRSKEQRLEEILSDAVTHLIYDRHSSAFSDLLTAVEISYGGLGSMPPNLTALIDKLNLMREESFA